MSVRQTKSLDGIHLGSGTWTQAGRMFGACLVLVGNVAAFHFAAWRRRVLQTLAMMMPITIVAVESWI